MRCPASLCVLRRASRWRPRAARRFVQPPCMVPHLRQGGCITPRSGANIQHPAGRRREQMQHMPMHIRKGQARILTDQRLRLISISLRATDMLGKAHLRRFQASLVTASRERFVALMVKGKISSVTGPGKAMNRNTVVKPLPMPPQL